VTESSSSVVESSSSVVESSSPVAESSSSSREKSSSSALVSSSGLSETQPLKVRRRTGTRRRWTLMGTSSRSSSRAKTMNHSTLSTVAGPTLTRAPMLVFLSRTDAQILPLHSVCFAPCEHSGFGGRTQRRGQG
ncbi:MAG TPA: hypothetical protein DIU15_06450, partial [Deltaproteobacteria bacterium]|nr:hypothetical protein [Deltaproteobacteria bacterium]